MTIQLGTSPLLWRTPDLVNWRANQRDGGTGSFEPRAKNGLAMMLELTGHAVRARLPMMLDY